MKCKNNSIGLTGRGKEMDRCDKANAACVPRRLMVGAGYTGVRCYGSLSFSIDLIIFIINYGDEEISHLD